MNSLSLAEIIGHWLPVFLNVIIIPLLYYIVKIEKRLIKLETVLEVVMKSLNSCPIQINHTKHDPFKRE